MKLFLALLSSFLLPFLAQAQIDKTPFEYMDVFSLQYADNPQISPDGKFVLYRKMGFDIMTDRSKGNIWIYDVKDELHSKLTNLEGSEYSPVWSPDGKRIAFVASTDEGSEIYIYWLKTGKYARISQLEYAPSNLVWSNDGFHLAFNMFVATKAPSISVPLDKPKGAEWAPTPRITTRLKHEANGIGYLKDGFTHIFTINANGGTPRQVTKGELNYRSSLSFTPDDKSLIFSTNLNDDFEYDFKESNIFKIDIETGKTTQLSAMKGPENAPQISPNGKFIAYLSYEDKVQTYQVTKLHVMNLDGSAKTIWTEGLDRSVKDFQWRSDSKAIYFTYDDHGITHLARISNSGLMKEMTLFVGGTTLGRPYASGSFSVSDKNIIAYTYSNGEAPSELKLYNVRREKEQRITFLNDDLFRYKKLGNIESVRYNSTVDKREIQGWIIKPPNYEEGKKYPLLVENHGGPILNYGQRFSAELQLYAAAGYLVFYPNPRGSTGYGEDFGNLLYNNYPGDDYQDVMDGVDFLIGKGMTSEDQLFVTGGSAGGIMTAWIIGKNNRFEAAVVHKPVINWISKTLVADNYYNYADYRYPGQPWENFETYWKFSPISLVGNIETPTMVMVGLDDLRTPPSEAKQLYHALKIRKKETMLVEIPGASHGIASRPSHMITKVAYTIDWCNRYRKDLNE